jgi:hypothetical protein
MTPRYWVSAVSRQYTGLIFKGPNVKDTFFKGPALDATDAPRLESYCAILWWRWLVFFVFVCNPSATLFTTNPTWPDHGTNTGLRDEWPMTKRLHHATAKDTQTTTFSRNVGTRMPSEATSYPTRMGNPLIAPFLSNTLGGNFSSIRVEQVAYIVILQAFCSQRV